MRGESTRSSPSLTFSFSSSVIDRIANLVEVLGVRGVIFDSRCFKPPCVVSLSLNELVALGALILPTVGQLSSALSFVA